MVSPLSNRIVTFLLDPGRRFRGLIVLAYGTAFAGLSISLFPGSITPGNRWLTVGLALMAFAFFLLFYLSVTVLESHGHGGRS